MQDQSARTRRCAFVCECVEGGAGGEERDMNVDARLTMSAVQLVRLEHVAAHRW